MSDKFWQAVRGLCIVCVVLIHSQNGLLFQNQPGLSWNFDYWMIERQIINFPVAIFIFLCGYFTRTDDALINPTQYLRSRMKRLLPSYLVWTTIYTIISFIGHHSLNLKTLIKNYFLGDAAAPLYYIIVLIQLTLLTPFVMKCIQSKNIHRLMFTITPLYLLFMYFYQIHYHTQLPFYSIFFPAWFGFYYIGLTVRMKGFPRILKEIPLLYPPILLLLALGCSFFESHFIFVHYSLTNFAASQIKFSSFLYVLAIINFLFILKAHRTSLSCRLLIILGNNSFGIYYIHCIFLIIFNSFISKISVVIQILPLYQLIQVVFAVGLSMATIKIVQKLFGKEKSKVYFGF